MHSIIGARRPTLDALDEAGVDRLNGAGRNRSGANVSRLDGAESDTPGLAHVHDGDLWYFCFYELIFTIVVVCGTLTTQDYILRVGWEDRTHIMQLMTGDASVGKGLYIYYAMFFVPHKGFIIFMLASVFFPTSYCKI